MKTRFNIAVRIGYENQNCVKNATDFYALQEIAFNLGLVRQIESIPEDMTWGIYALGEFPSPEFDEFVEALAKLGIRPQFGSAQDVPEGFFFVGLENIYSEEDLDVADFLYIQSFSETWLSGDGCEDGVWFIKTTSFDEAEPHEYAQIWGGGIPLVGPRLKEKLEREHFLALELPEVKWVPEGTRPAELWQLHSSVTMPPCKSRVVDDGGVAFFKEENGAKNARIEFNKEAVAALGKFDIAMIREKLGNTSPCFTHYADTPKYIISQRLRRFFLANNIQPGLGVVRFV